MGFIRLIAVASLVAACGVAPTPRGGTDDGEPQRAVYQFSPDPLPAEVSASGTIEVTWRPEASGERVLKPVQGRLCAALVGPYDSVERLKTASVDARDCPIERKSLVSASESTEVDLTSGSVLRQALVPVSPLAPGFYQVITVSSVGERGASSAVSSAQIVRVRPD